MSDNYLSYSTGNVGERSYSIAWAKCVVYTFAKQYARATVFVREILGITTNQLIHYCATDQKCWRFLRDAIKSLGKASPDKHSGPQSDDLGIRMLSSIIKIRMNSDETNLLSLLNLLTKKINSVTNKERDFKGIVFDDSP